jgi:hypothetical protein
MSVWYLFDVYFIWPHVSMPWSWKIKVKKTSNRWLLGSYLNNLSSLVLTAKFSGLKFLKQSMACIYCNGQSFSHVVMKKFLLYMIKPKCSHLQITFFLELYSQSESNNFLDFVLIVMVKWPVCLWLMIFIQSQIPSNEAAMYSQKHYFQSHTITYGF